MDKFVGCGINFTNSDPTMCINDVINLYNKQHGTNLSKLTIPEVIALTLSSLEHLIDLFQTQGREHVLQRYYKRWLHRYKLLTVYSYLYFIHFLLTASTITTAFITTTITTTTTTTITSTTTTTTTTINTTINTTTTATTTTTTIITTNHN